MNSSNIATKAIVNPSPKINSDELNIYMSRLYFWTAALLCIRGLIIYYISSAPYLQRAMQLDSSLIIKNMSVISVVFILFLKSAGRNLGAVISTPIKLTQYALHSILISIIASNLIALPIGIIYLATATGVFCLSLFGLNSKRNLNGSGYFFMVTSLCGVAAMYLASVFFPSLHINIVQTPLLLLGVAIISLFTALDVKKIKRKAQTKGKQPIARAF